MNKRRLKLTKYQIKIIELLCLDYGQKNCNWVTFTLEENSPIKDTFLLKRDFKLTEKAYLLECK